jgi:hypothetical protein
MFPVIAYFALFLVLITKLVSGDIHFKFSPTFEISGAASEGLMWILVFVSLTWGFSELWKLGDTAPLPAPVPAMHSNHQG